MMVGFWYRAHIWFWEMWREEFCVTVHGRLKAFIKANVWKTMYYCYLEREE